MDEVPITIAVHGGLATSTGELPKILLAWPLTWQCLLPMMSKKFRISGGNNETICLGGCKPLFVRRRLRNRIRPARASHFRTHVH